MKLLITSGVDVNNPYISYLKAAYESVGIEVSCGTDFFWNSEEKFDIVHIQWPESLTNWSQEPDQELLLQLEKRLIFWKKSAVLVCTIHNYNTHYLNKEKYSIIYRLVYQLADGIVHMGLHSQQYYWKNYEFAPNQEHVIIPHGPYHYPNHISKHEARRKLGISSSKFVVLCFGAIRTMDETRHIKKVLQLLETPQKLLLTSGWPYLNTFKSKILKWVHFFHPYYHITNKHVTDDEIQIYFNAADFVFLPRTDTLNSGVLHLAFSFKKVVVGAKVGNSQEILEKAGNPTFLPNDWDSLSSALREINNCMASGIGDQNWEYIHKECSWEKSASKYKDFFEKLVGLKNDI